jgi:hypothetical protein
MPVAATPAAPPPPAENESSAPLVQVETRRELIDDPNRAKPE